MNTARQAPGNAPPPPHRTISMSQSPIVRTREEPPLYFGMRTGRVQVHVSRSPTRWLATEYSLRQYQQRNWIMRSIVAWQHPPCQSPVWSAFRRQYVILHGQWRHGWGKLNGKAHAPHWDFRRGRRMTALMESIGNGHLDFLPRLPVAVAFAGRPGRQAGAVPEVQPVVHGARRARQRTGKAGGAVRQASAAARTDAG